MSQRVLTTVRAEQAIMSMKRIIDGGLADQLKALDAQCRILSDPSVWDGETAIKFRKDVWPATKAALDKARAQLDELRGSMGKVSGEIFKAGGG